MRKVVGLERLKMLCGRGSCYMDVERYEGDLLGESYGSGAEEAGNGEQMWLGM